MKICSKCNQELTLNNFYRDNRSPSVKYRSICKKCTKLQYIRTYRTVNTKQHICKNCQDLFLVNCCYAPNPQFCSTKCHAAFKSQLDYDESFWTEELQSYIDGLMLSDICIRRDNCFQWNVKYEEFAQLVAKYLLPYGSYVKKYSSKMYTGRTRTHPDIKFQRGRWYPDDIKIVPQDVKINQASLLMMYIGDGCLHKTKGNITISTLSFSEKDNLFLSDRILNLGIASRVLSRNNQYYLYFSRPNAVKFLNFLGNSSPIKCYDYKFQMPSKQIYRDYQRNLRRKIAHEKN